MGWLAGSVASPEAKTQLQNSTRLKSTYRLFLTACLRHRSFASLLILQERLTRFPKPGQSISNSLSTQSNSLRRLGHSISNFLTIQSVQPRPPNDRPNPAFERTAASALRLLAVPSSLRSSAAAQRERWASNGT
jgi:hypothetical protein